MRFFAIVLTLLFSCSPGLLHAQQHHGDALDDVLQHTPLAATLLMKACGADNRERWSVTLGTAVGAYVLAAGTTYALKHGVSEWRPDRSDRRSFPSGHATFAFAGAAVLRHEYGHVSPWVGVGAYSVATLTAADRVVRDRHHWYDVCAGAAVGTLAAELTYYAKGRILKSEKATLAFSPQTISFSLVF